MSLGVGIIDLTSGSWTGGATYSEVTVKSALAAASAAADTPRVKFISPADGNQQVPSIRCQSAPPLPWESEVRRILSKPQRSQRFRGETRVRQLLRLPDSANPIWLAEQNELNAVFPVMSPTASSKRSKLALLGWIPDLQHLVHPEFFSQRQINERNSTCSGLIERSAAVVVSSMSARDDCLRSFPNAAAKLCVLTFPSRFAFSPPSQDVSTILDLYNLPSRYILCANQYWAHKNHALLIDAIRQLRDRGIRIPVVMTGLPLDSRSTTNAPTSKILQTIASSRLSGQIVPLGLVPRDHLDGLIRGASMVVQPSFHEGWNTTVQDAKALGKTILCADTPVLREQAPGAQFFEFRVESLVSALLKSWEVSDPVDHSAAEEQALVLERGVAQKHGELFLDLCRKVIAQ